MSGTLPPYLFSFPNQSTHIATTSAVRDDPLDGDGKSVSHDDADFRGTPSLVLFLPSLHYFMSVSIQEIKRDVMIKIKTPKGQ
ncbi:hypothetical protein BLNAU_12658 [Blattamonas nauphoetae]|uniref:Uncharacterized protein n=1 Tax=Blattamonas nauphoetae TaxID=2049346 RepID=A0ABQ9XK63_9EUKA|nr:hypothetical protein BLNAU_12658 [Blattamonas nauphoetae]